MVTHVLLRVRFDILVNDASSCRIGPKAPLGDIGTWLTTRGQLFYRPIEHWLETAQWLAFGTNWLPGILIHGAILGTVAVFLLLAGSTLDHFNPVDALR